MKLWIDDVRPAPEGWKHAYTSEEALEMIRSNPAFEWISFDHDLGVDEHGEEDSVRHVINTLWVYGQESDKLPRYASVHSDNYPGAQWIKGTLESISRHVKCVEVVSPPGK